MLLQTRRCNCNGLYLIVSIKNQDKGLFKSRIPNEGNSVGVLLLEYGKESLITTKMKNWLITILDAGEFCSFGPYKMSGINLLVLQDCERLQYENYLDFDNSRLTIAEHRQE